MGEDFQPTSADAYADAAWADYQRKAAEQARQGRCPYSGLSLVSCRRSDLCDCFGWDDEPPGTPPAWGTT